MNYPVREIDVPWVMEIITEKFDQSALNNMTEFSLIYGGAIRDALAGLPLIGDLDIVVPYEQSTTLLGTFNNSPKWIKVDVSKAKAAVTKAVKMPMTGRINRTLGQDPEASVTNDGAHRRAVPESSWEHSTVVNEDAVVPVRFTSPEATSNAGEISVQRVGYPDLSSLPDAENIESEASEPPRDVADETPGYHPASGELRQCVSEVGRGYDKHSFNPYKDTMPISKTIMYEASNGAKTQIVIVRPKHAFTSLSGIDAVFDMIRRVDITCCGLAMDRSGKVFEIIEGAYEDCKNKTLRFNKAIIESVNIDRFRERVTKLEKRGWSSKIDIGRIEGKHKKIVEMKKRRERQEKRKEEARKAKQEKASTTKKSKKGMLKSGFTNISGIMGELGTMTITNTLDADDIKKIKKKLKTTHIRSMYSAYRTVG